MGVLKNIRSVFPIPKDWERDSDRRNFAVRVDQALRTLFSKKTISAIRVNDAEVKADDHDVVDLRQIVRYSFSLPNNGTRTLTINATGTYTFLMITASNSSTMRGMWLLQYQGSNSKTSADEIKGASALTVTAGVEDGVYKISKSGTTIATAVIFLVCPVTSNGPTITAT